ncbi:alanine dehydrogenase [Aurantivibrio infirmus]
MRIGVPKEIKNHEYRVSLLPEHIAVLSASGHECRVEIDAGAAIGYDDQQYRNAGAIIVKDGKTVYSESELIVKVKEPQALECEWLNQNHILFGFLHLAVNLELVQALQQSRASCIAYETVSDAAGHLPLLTPMSEIAGRMSIQAAIHHLENPQGGRGVLLGGVPGVAPAKVLIIGGGVVGTQAAAVAVGLGADVTVLDRSIPRLRELQELFSGRVKTLAAHAYLIEQEIIDADVVIGAVLVSGAKAPKVISRKMIRKMKSGSVIVDVAIDQGGCFETSKPTNHDAPTFVVDGVIHYCVANIPGAVALSATQALTNATFPMVAMIANLGLEKALDNPGLASGLNIYQGKLLSREVAESLNLPHTKFGQIFA